MRFFLPFLLYSVLLASFRPGAVRGQQLRDAPAVIRPADPVQAAARLRALQFMRDFEGGALEGQELVERFPDALRLRAWYLVNRARHGETEEAAADAEAMVADHPASPWSHFALAGALNWHDERSDEAHDAIEEALDRAPPGHPDFIWLKAEVLSDKAEEALAFIEQHTNEVENPAELLNMKGYVLYVQSRDLEGEAADEKMDEALAAYEAARQVDPDNVNAHYLPGYQLLFMNRTEEAYPLLKKAAAHSTAIRIHSRYWRAVMGLTDRSAAEKRTEVTADIEKVLEGHPTPTALHRAAERYGELDMDDRRRALEDRLLEQHPRSQAAEWMLVGRYRDFRQAHREDFEDDPELKARYRQMLRDFIDRPHHNRETLIGDAYRELFYTLRDDSTGSSDELLEVVQGMVRYEGINPHITHAGGAIALAERNTHFDTAERIARAGIAEARKKIDEQNERGVYDTEEEYQRARGRYTAIMYDALGWVYLKAGRMGDAEEALLHAFELDENNRDNLYHLGQFYEAKGSPEEAERSYVKGLGVQRPGPNPNEEALERLYATTRGSLDGYETYLADLKAEERSERREEVLAGRLEEPEPMPTFQLETLGDSTVSAASLGEKVLVINIWGKWCGPCVQEMPDIQKLYEKYRSDPDVMVLTINNDPDPDDVRTWMAEHEYTFPVLLDDGYLTKHGVHAFPTTWFVGPEGRTAFIKTGWTKELVEEFGWRVEALRASDPDNGEG